MTPKKIIYRGQVYELPEIETAGDWQFIGTDQNGDIYVYSHKPPARDIGFRADFGAAKLVAVGSVPADDWRDSLARIDECFTPWEGGDCPVPDNAWVDVNLRDGLLMVNCPACSLRWSKCNVGVRHDIVSYRLHKPATQGAAIVDHADVAGVTAEATGPVAEEKATNVTPSWDSAPEWATHLVRNGGDYSKADEWKFFWAQCFTQGENIFAKSAKDGRKQEMSTISPVHGWRVVSVHPSLAPAADGNVVDAELPPELQDCAPNPLLVEAAEGKRKAICGGVEVKQLTLFRGKTSTLFVGLVDGLIGEWSGAGFPYSKHLALEPVVNKRTGWVNLAKCENIEKIAAYTSNVFPTKEMADTYSCGRIACVPVEWEE